MAPAAPAAAGDLSSANKSGPAGAGPLAPLAAAPSPDRRPVFTLIDSTLGGVEDPSDVQDSALAALRMMSEELSRQAVRVDESARYARSAGCSWRQIGNQLGMSPQAAHKRYAAGQPSG